MKPKMKRLILIALTIILFSGCSREKIKPKNDLNYKLLKGKVESLIEYRYEVYDNEKGKLRSESEEKFNEHGNKIVNSLTVMPNPTPSTTTLEYKYDKNDFPYECITILSDGEILSNVIMKYDDLGNMIYFQEVSDGRIKNTKYNTFDKRNNKIEERELGYDNREIVKTYYKYDNNNKEIERESYSDNRSEGKILFKNDEYGNPILTTYYDSQGYYNRSFRHIYEYDNVGNWTKRTMWKDDTMVALAERHINYYK